MTPVVVFGATSLIGTFLLPRLEQRGHRLTAVSRNRYSATPTEVEWLQQDIGRIPFDFNGRETAISLAPIWVFGEMLKKCRSAPARIIAFSSTSAVVKVDSRTPSEQAIANRLIQGERDVAAFCRQHGIALTIFRPTMVYGAGLDANVTVIARFVDRYGFFPILGGGTGLRSPVHAADLADAVVSCLETPAAEGLYTLTGGEDLSYHEMVERIFAGLGRPPRILRIPAPIARAAVHVARRLPAYAGLTPAMVDRTGQDLVFDCSEARRRFDYSPRPFRPGRNDLLPRE